MALDRPDQQIAEMQKDIERLRKLTAHLLDRVHKLERDNIRIKHEVRSAHALINSVLRRG